MSRQLFDFGCYNDNFNIIIIANFIFQRPMSHKDTVIVKYEKLNSEDDLQNYENKEWQNSLKPLVKCHSANVQEKELASRNTLFSLNEASLKLVENAYMFTTNTLQRHFDGFDDYFEIQLSNVFPLQESNIIGVHIDQIDPSAINQ